jgi:quercetin dioxygenase-like cupin family protein
MSEQQTTDSHAHSAPADIHGSHVAQDASEPPLTYLQDLLDLAPLPQSGLGHSTVLNAPDVRVIVLAFSAGHILKQHAAPFTLLMQALDGHLLVTSNGQELDLRPGGLIRMDPGLPHSVEAYVDSRLQLTLIPA